MVRAGPDCEWQPSNTLTLEVFSSPTVDAGDDVEIYTDQSAALTATPTGVQPFTFAWSDGLGSNGTVIAYPSSTTTYYVTVTDGNGCTATDFVTVTVEDFPDECSTNLIDNWSFENGLSSWDVTGFVDREDNRYNQFGDWYVYIYYNGQTSSISQQVDNIVPGESYTLNFFGGTHDNQFGHSVELAFYDADDNFLDGESVEVDFVVGCCNYTVNYPMEYYTIESIAPENTSYLKVIATNTSGDYLKMDGVCLDGVQCDLPSVGDDNFETCTDNLLTGNVGDNDVFAPGSSFEIVANPSFGSLQLENDGSFTYQPESGFAGIDEFVYKVCNTAACCATASAFILVESNPVVSVVSDDPDCTAAKWSHYLYFC